MMTRCLKLSRVAFVAGAIAMVSAPELEAQSVFNAAGLGVPSEALDGRSRAMGSMGIGLPGGAFMPTDPAALGRLSVATGVVANQPSWVDYSAAGGPSGSFQGNRFPLMGLAYPVFDGMMSFQVGSFLDQNYTDSRTGTVDLSTETVATNDEFIQDGSVSNLNLGYAQRLGTDVSVGVTVGRYAGSIVRTLTRTFGDEIAADVNSYVESGRWAYSGFHLTTGVSATLTDRYHVAASVQIPSNLDAEAQDDTDGADRTFDLPVQYRAGVSATFGPVLLGASAVLADWSETQADLTGSVQAGSANGYGLGVEFARARLWGRDAPLRFGYRRSTLPFAFDADEVTERIFSGGVGLALNRTNDITLAAVDLAVERGRRWAGGISENFWRGTISFQAAGF
ncbi:MAG: hypothetical protein HKN72_13975 [Gemmatimonadetes bacterium]|nr:hypothetical protein [Gemmatimonadota bacterium]